MTSGSSAAKKPTRVVAYLRASTDEKAREGVSLAFQRAQIKAQVFACDLRLVAVYTDPDASARSLARRGLRAALRALLDGRADGLLIFNLDRLTRSMRDLGHLLNEYFRDRFMLLSVSDRIDTRTTSGRLVLDVLASVAEWDREAISGRTRIALPHLEKESEVRLGRPPLEALGADGAATVERARQLRDQGLALRTIAEKLAKEGRQTARGGRWAPETVRLLLVRAT